ncbi:MAG: NOB1 family endonuclease [Candidatus Methanomethylicia archaeon]
MKMKKIIILDSSAIINGYNPLLSVDGKHVLSSYAVNEILSKNKREKIERAIELGKLEVWEPKSNFIKMVEEASRETNDIKNLSISDISTIALALEAREKDFMPVIMTDDFSIQNVAKYLNIETLSIATTGIRKIIKWVLYCPACGRTYDYEKGLNVCKICGTKLKRKPRP